MGMLIDLYEYLQHRSAAAAEMQQAWPLCMNYDFTAALEVLTQIVGNTILTTLRHITQLRSQVSSFQNEHLTRRAFETGRRYTTARRRCKSADLQTSSSFEKTLKHIRDELAALYKARGDYSEVNRLHVEPGQHEYLADFNFEMMSNLASGLSRALKLTFDDNDIKDVYRRVLDPGGSLQIGAEHLGILRGQKNGTIDRAACRLGSAIEITGRNLLHLAAEMSDVSYLEWALRKQRQLSESMLETRDTFGLTPLMIASYVGCLETFKILAEFGANLKAQDLRGKSILCLASMAGHEPIVSYVLSKGVKINDCIEFCSPIHDAAAAGRSEAVIQTLLAHKAEPRDERGEHENRCASQVAIHHGHKEVAAVLAEAEKRLEKQLPTKQIDPQGHQIRFLKRKFASAIARSRSPESPPNSSSASTAQLSQNKSGRKRQVSQDQWSMQLSASSKYTTPGPLASTPFVPSSLRQSSDDMYRVDTFSKTDDSLLSETFSQFIDSTQDFRLFDSVSSQSYIDLTDDET